MVGSDIHTSAKRSQIMTTLKNKDSNLELKLRSTLDKLGYRYGLHSKPLPGKPDIVLRKHHPAIFVNGCFWHQYKKCRESVRSKSNVDFWNTKLDWTIKRESTNIVLLAKANWKVLVAWEFKIETNMNTVLQNWRPLISR